MVFVQSTRYSCPILMCLAFSRQISYEYLNTKFHENPSSGSLVVPRGLMEGWTDILKLTVALRILLARQAIGRIVSG